METPILTIRIDLPMKKSVNDYRNANHFKLNNWKSDFADTTYYELKRQNTQPIPKDFYPVRCVYTFYFKGRLLDWDNTASMVKFIQDAFIKGKILTDDTNKYIREGTLRVEKSEEKISYVIVEFYRL